jgi:hypothetical protein
VGNERSEAKRTAVRGKIPIPQPKKSGTPFGVPDFFFV